MKHHNGKMPRLVAEPHTLPLPLEEGRGEGSGIAGLGEGFGVRVLRIANLRGLGYGG